MYALWILGGLIEKSVGRVPARASCTSCPCWAGPSGALIISPDALTVGASGAIFGLMGAVLALGRSRGISIRNSPVLGVLVINLLLTFGLSSVISVGGHIGGLIAGFLAGMVLFELPPRVAQRPGRPEPRQQAMAAATRAAYALAGGAGGRCSSWAGSWRPTRPPSSDRRAQPSIRARSRRRLRLHTTFITRPPTTPPTGPPIHHGNRSRSLQVNRVAGAPRRADPAEREPAGAGHEAVVAHPHRAARSATR